MKSTKLINIILFALTLTLLLSSCSYFSADRPRFGGGELLDDERISEIKAEIFSDDETATQTDDGDNGQNDETEQTQSNEGQGNANGNNSGDTSAEAAPDETVDDANEESVPHNDTSEEDEHSTVYWTEGGSVWHVSKECSSLKNSKNIISGSVEEAQNAGKERVCSRCGKE